MARAMSPAATVLPKLRVPSAFSLGHAGSPDFGLAPEQKQPGAGDNSGSDDQAYRGHFAPDQEAQNARPDQGQIIERSNRGCGREMQCARPPVLPDGIGSAVEG